MKRPFVVYAFVAAPALLVAAAAAAAPEEHALAVGPKGGSFAFAVTKPGSITVHLTAPSAIRARLVGPKGEAATKGPGTSLDLTATATEADVAAGKLWVVAASSEGPTKGLAAAAKVESPSGPVAEKDLVAQIEVATRAAPKVPQALPPPTPLLPDAAAVTKIVAAKIPGGKASASAIGGKIVRNATTIPPFVPQPPTPGVKAPPAAGNNYGGVLAEPTAAAGRTTVPIYAIDVADEDGAHACNGPTCAIKAGDVVTFTLGPGIEALGHEVHFVFFEPAHDVAVSVLEWKDDVRKVAVQMPHLGADAFDKAGAIFIGTASGKATSSFYGFKYDPMVTLFLPMDGRIFPPPATVYAPAPAPPEHPAFAYSGPLDNATRWFVMRGAAVGMSGRDAFFGGVALKNGWVVKRLEAQSLAGAALPTLQGGVTLSELKAGSSTASFTVDWTADAATSLSYSVAVKVSGRDGTLPF